MRGAMQCWTAVLGTVVAVTATPAFALTESEAVAHVKTSIKTHTAQLKSDDASAITTLDGALSGLLVNVAGGSTSRTDPVSEFAQALHIAVAGVVAAGTFRVEVRPADGSTVGVDVTDTNTWLRTFTSLPEGNCRVKLRDLLANSDIVDLSEGAIGIP